MHRFRFFGRDTVSLLVVLPIALPGIVTGMALHGVLSPASTSVGLTSSRWSLAHATFCIVVVYNNVVARLRRLSPNARGGLGRTSGPTGSRPSGYVTFPLLRSALARRRAAGLRAVLRRDHRHHLHRRARVETLPQWILRNVPRPQAGPPLINVVATTVIVLSVVPVWLSQRIAEGGGIGRGILRVLNGVPVSEPRRR